MTHADRLRDYAARVAVAMGLDPSRVVVDVAPFTMHPGITTRARVACCGKGHGVWVDRGSFGATAHGTDDESAVDAAVLALSSRLSARSREAVDEARRAVDIAEWWQRAATIGDER